MAFITPVVLKAQYGPDSGKLPADVLAVCGTKPWLMWEPAARCHRAMMAAARTAGFDPRSTGTYRSYARQEALFRERYSPTGQYGGCKMWHGVKWCKQLVNGRVPADAAVPGTSEHGWGCADDVAEELDGDIVAEAISPEFFAWLQANAWAYGFENTNRTERWHWAYCLGGIIPQAVLDYETPPAPDPDPIPPFPPEEDEMKYIHLTCPTDPSKPEVLYALDGEGAAFIGFASPGDRDALVLAFQARHAAVSPAQFDVMIAAAQGQL